MVLREQAYVDPWSRTEDTLDGPIPASNRGRFRLDGAEVSKNRDALGTCGEGATVRVQAKMCREGPSDWSIREAPADKHTESIRQNNWQGVEGRICKV